MSGREQAGVDPADADVRRGSPAGNRAYEERFGRIYLVRAAGRSADRDPRPARAAARQRPRDRARGHRAASSREIAVLRLRRTGDSDEHLSHPRPRRRPRPPRRGPRVDPRRPRRASCSRTATTDADGRVAVRRRPRCPAATRLVFETGAWFAAAGRATFFPEVASRSPSTRRSGTTTWRCCSARSPTPPTEGADMADGDVVLGANQYGKAECRLVRITRDTAPARDRGPQRHLAAARRLRGLPHRRRQQPGGRDRHPEEHRLRLRQGARRRLARAVPAHARPALRRRLRVGQRRPLGGRAVRLGADRRRRRAARPRLRPDRPGDPHRGGPAGRRRHPRRRRAQGLHGAEVDRLGVPRLPARPLHDAAPRPTTASSPPA